MPRCLAPLCLALLFGCWPVLAEEPGEAPAPATEAEETEAAAEPVERPSLPERSEQDAQALQRHFDDAEQQQLQTAEERFLALWLPANVGTPNGLVIILPGDNLHAAAPQVVAPLRRKLPDAGWHSLSLTLPDPLSDLPLPRPLPLPPTNPEDAEPTAAGSDDGEPAAETAEEGAAPPDSLPAPDGAADAAQTQQERDQALAAHAERVFARIEAALIFATQRESPRVILLGHGSGAYWAARFLKEKPAPGINGLLLVSPQVPAGFAPSIEELAPTLSLPVGDLFYKDQAAERSAALRRLQASKRLKAADYRQVALKALPGNTEAEQEQLYRRARGWLEQQIKPR